MKKSKFTESFIMSILKQAFELQKECIRANPVWSLDFKNNYPFYGVN